MTITTQTSTITAQGTGAQSVYQFPFVYNNTTDIVVTITSAALVDTVLLPTQYSIAVNPPAPGQLWGVGGSITYPLSGPPLAVGNYITIARAVPDQQTTALSYQGGFFPPSVEGAMDVLCMEIQQLNDELARALLVPVGWPMTPLQYFIYLLNLYGGGGSGGGTIVQTANIITISVSTAIQETDFGILANATSGPINVTLPSAASFPGRLLQIKKIDNSPNAVTILGTIDSASSYPLNFYNEAVVLQSNGAGWYVF